nr:MAG TPA: Splicing factor 3B subunit 4 complex, splicing, RNA, protein [Caudoviricetes sp.]
MLDWNGKPIPFGESVIINVGSEGDNIKDDPKEIHKYILEELSGVAIAADDQEEKS